MRDKEYVINKRQQNSLSKSTIIKQDTLQREIEEVHQVKKEYVFLDEFDVNNREDFNELFSAIERDNEPIATQTFFYPIDKDFEYDDILTDSENLRTLIKHQLFKAKLNTEKFVSYKIKLNVNRSIDFSIGYLETHQKKGHLSTLIVARFYIYKMYRHKGYVKRAAESIFKELFIRFYSIKKLKVVIFENDLVMKHMLINQGYKLHESKSSTAITNIQLMYVITREEMRELKK